ncbi:hypothetical protein KHA96_20440 [Bacillus sp. FJAT-49711]|uniref:hypothetical protein n=1 Tax=Bacillus sp. FJAT-49711 TaxID=2833585 RepID=UPI001BCA11EF|nr:hypothetical protein [Bacillus sp. FJAT-49711]MBS4220670.1 hypothetical protein [Bacillus sp. FJAT-49711]
MALLLIPLAILGIIQVSLENIYEYFSREEISSMTEEDNYFVNKYKDQKKTMKSPQCPSNNLDHFSPKGHPESTIQDPLANLVIRSIHSSFSIINHKSYLIFICYIRGQIDEFGNKAYEKNNWLQTIGIVQKKCTHSVKCLLSNT